MTEWVFFLQLSPSRFVDLDDTMVGAPAIGIRGQMES